MQAVDVKLCDHPLSYDAALITLRSCAPDWMRGVLTASLAAAEQQRDAAEAVTLARLQKLATWFDWSPAECMVARLVWHATQFEWCYRLLDELAHAANDAGRAYSTVLPLDLMACVPVRPGQRVHEEHVPLARVSARTLTRGALGLGL